MEGEKGGEEMERNMREREKERGVTCRVKLIGRGGRRFVTFGFLVRGVVSAENTAGSGETERGKKT